MTGETAARLDSGESLRSDVRRAPRALKLRPNTQRDRSVANFNKVILMGNLTRDVELRHTQGGQALAKFGMAINRKYSVNGEQKESTCFVDLTAWGKQAELLNQYLRKGSQLFVEGRLDYSTWESQEGGKRSKLEVVVENFQFVGAPRGANASGGGSGGAAPAGDEPGGGERRAPARRPAQQEGATGGGEVDYGDIPF